MNGSSSAEPSLLGVRWKNNLLPGNSQANFLTDSHQTLKTCCMQVNRMQISVNAKTATVGKTLKVSRDGEEEHRRAQMQLIEQQDMAERRSRQRSPS